MADYVGPLEGAGPSGGLIPQYVIAEGGGGAGSGTGGSGGGAGGTTSTAWENSPWYTLWLKVGFSAPVATAAAKAAIANPNDLSGMFHVIRSSREYANLFPGIDSLSSAQGWNFADYGNSPEASYYSWKQNITNYGRQYGYKLSQADVANYAFRGWGQADVNNFFQGEQWVKANQGDLSYYLGNFGTSGTGKLSAGDLQDLAAAQGGLASKRGTGLEQMFQQAMQRAQTVFQGTLANIGQSIGYVDPTKTPDAGA